MAASSDISDASRRSACIATACSNEKRWTSRACERSTVARASSGVPSGPSHDCVSKVSRYIAASPQRLDMVVAATQPSTKRPYAACVRKTSAKTTM
eukprot:scaffold246844_cov26-Tisochrysis_lutea.AAC.5